MTSSWVKIAYLTSAWGLVYKEMGLVVYWLSGKQWNKLPSLEKNLAVLEWTREILEHAEHAIREAQQTGKGSAWSIKYVANNRKRSFVKENLN